MVMDLLRSCYRQRIRFVDGDPSQTAVATWYFAAKTAKPLPFPHAFGSPTWDIVHPTPTTIGFNAEASRSYYNGRSLNSSPGDRFAGQAAWFVRGAPQPANLPRTLNGTPLECLTPPLGLQLSGSSVNVTGNKATLLLSAGSYIPTPPVNPCTFCSVTPSSVTATLSGLTVSFLNGTHSLVQQSDPCMWEVPVSTGFVRLTRFGTIWILLADDGVGGSAFYTSGTYLSCIDVIGLLLSGTNIGGDPTATAVTS